MPYSPDIHLQQAGLASLGFDPGPIDGLTGPLTRAARSAWETSRTSPGTIASRLVAVAKEQLALRLRETSPNQGPGIEKLWSATTYPEGYQNREPYCAAGVCWCVREACKGIPTAFKLPTTPLAFGFDSWAAANATSGILPHVAPANARPGDIVVFTFSHVGIVIDRDKAGNLITIEFNTDAAGSREGGGVFQKTRALALARSLHRITA